MPLTPGSGASPATAAKKARRQQRWTRRLPTIIIVLTALTAAASVIEAFFDRADARRAEQHEAELTEVGRLQAALVDAETSVRGYALTGQPDELGKHLSATRVLAGGSPLLPALNADAAMRAGANGDQALVSDALSGLRAIWQAGVRLARDNQQAQAGAVLMAADASELSQRLHEMLAGYLDRRTAAEAELHRQSETEQAILRILTFGSAFVAIIAMVYAFGSIMRAITAGFAAKEQVEQLFSMADMLQSAAGQEDTNEVLRATAARLLPGFSGALYVFNNSRDRLDLSTHWGPQGEQCADHLLPDACWALKRGKPHLNGLEDGDLRCVHATHAQVKLEIPMAARGQLYGLLQIIAPDTATGADRLAEVQPVASAMADAMSLALSSIALRERLRNQALRDALTGLYNRRFLEEMLERICMDAERRKVSVSAIMLDLDHFKKLNDQHGHGAGDAVLREVAATILSCLRGVDVACRYGGEEIAILLPDCPAAMATGKAEQIRSRIAALSAPAGVSVSASLGVASIPETTARPAELLTMADAALYQAKQQGRDRVVVAPTRPAAQRLSLIEAEPESTLAAQVAAGNM